MKKSVLIIGFGVLAVAGAAGVVASKAAPKEEKVDWRSKRGTAAYYVSDEMHYEIQDISVNLKGDNGQRYLNVGIAVSYKIGPELIEEQKKEAMAAAAGGHGGGHGGGGGKEGGNTPFDKAKFELKDRLTTLLSNKTFADVEGKEKKAILKQEVLEEIEHAVFPEKLGRIENVYWKQFIVQ